MWAAIKAYAKKSGNDANAIVAELKGDGMWNESADYFEMIAMKYEALNG